MAELLFIVGCLAEEGIPQDPRDSGITGMQASPCTPLGVIGKVLGVVDPPGAVVIP